VQFPAWLCLPLFVLTYSRVLKINDDDDADDDCKFGDKICHSSRDIEFLLGDYFLLARPVQFNPNKIR